MARSKSPFMAKKSEEAMNMTKKEMQKRMPMAKKAKKSRKKGC
jgi:hypothetical protein